VALITSSSAKFAAALPRGGKLAGLDVGTRTVGLAICDAGWSFAGPAETIRRSKFTQDLEALRG
jgi:putative holliday junction resolvase